MKQYFLTIYLALAALVITGSGFSTEVVNVQISDFTFKPETINIKPGTTVNWVNTDKAPHTITSDDGSWDSGKINNSAEYSHTFDKAGTFKYHCAFHSSMTGSVIVSP